MENPGPGNPAALTFPNAGHLPRDPASRTIVGRFRQDGDDGGRVSADGFQGGGFMGVSPGPGFGYALSGSATISKTNHSARWRPRASKVTPTRRLRRSRPGRVLRFTIAGYTRCGEEAVSRSVTWA